MCRFMYAQDLIALRTYLFTAPDATLHVYGFGDVEIGIQALCPGFRKKFYSHKLAESVIC